MPIFPFKLLITDNNHLLKHQFHENSQERMFIFPQIMQQKLKTEVPSFRPGVTLPKFNKNSIFLFRPSRFFPFAKKPTLCPKNTTLKKKNQLKKNLKYQARAPSNFSLIQYVLQVQCCKITVLNQRIALIFEHKWKRPNCNYYH